MYLHFGWQSTYPAGSSKEEADRGGGVVNEQKLEELGPQQDCTGEVNAEA